MQVIAIEELAKQETFDHKLCINLSSLEISLPRDTQLMEPMASSRWTQLRFYRRVLRRVKQLRADYSSVRVAIPHPYHSIGNYLAFSLAADQVDLLPDGALNYY